MTNFKSWKTATGSITLALGGAILAASQFIGAADPKLDLWFKVIGTIFFSFGSALMGYGVSDRVTKTAAKTSADCLEPQVRPQTPTGAPSGLPDADKPTKPIGQRGSVNMLVAGSILVALVAVLVVSACGIKDLKPISEMSPQEKATFFLSVYNKQYENYNITVKRPDLTAAQVKVLEEKKKIMTEVYPMISLYAGYVNAGALPDASEEKAIIDYLDRLGSLTAK